MAPATTTQDICGHCGSAWRPGWERCRRCGATPRNRVHTPVPGAQASDTSGLELDRRPRPPRARPPERGLPRASHPEASEAPTRELAPVPRPPTDPTPRVAAAQLLSGTLALLLVLQVTVPATLPSMTMLAVHAFRGEHVGLLRWLAACLPWALTAAVFALALAAARDAVGQRLARSPVGAALAAVLPGVLLWGWPAVHGHLASALVRRGGRRRADLLTGWSRAVLGCLSAEVLLTAARRAGGGGAAAGGAGGGGRGGARRAAGAPLRAVHRPARTAAPAVPGGCAAAEHARLPSVR